MANDPTTRVREKDAALVVTTMLAVPPGRGGRRNPRGGTEGKLPYCPGNIPVEHETMAQ